MEVSAVCFFFFLFLYLLPFSLALSPLRFFQFYLFSFFSLCSIRFRFSMLVSTLAQDFLAGGTLIAGGFGS